MTMPKPMCLVAPIFPRGGLNRSRRLHRNPHRHIPHFLASSAMHAAPGSSNYAFRRRLGRTASAAGCTDETLTISQLRGDLHLNSRIIQRMKVRDRKSLNLFAAQEPTMGSKTWIRYHSERRTICEWQSPVGEVASVASQSCPRMQASKAMRQRCRLRKVLKFTPTRASNSSTFTYSYWRRNVRAG